MLVSVCVRVCGLRERNGTECEGTCHPRSISTDREVNGSIDSFQKAIVILSFSLTSQANQHPCVPPQRPNAAPFVGSWTNTNKSNPFDWAVAALRVEDKLRRKFYYYHEGYYEFEK